MTASPPVASSIGAADCEPSVAAIHLYCDASCSSSLVSALLTWVLPDRPPIPPAPPDPSVPPGPWAALPPVPGAPPWVPVPVPVPVPPAPGVPVDPEPAEPGAPGKPPNAPATVGPALGIAPVCVVVAVSSEYASGPPRPATS